jgi:hypothetical protein
MKYINKQFLNDSADETGFIVVKATSERYEDLTRYYAEHPSCDAEVQIGDCSKKIYLDCSIHKEADLKKRTDKINVLIDNLVGLRDILPVIWADAVLQSTLWLEENKDVEEEEMEIVPLNTTGLRTL